MAHICFVLSQLKKEFTRILSIIGIISFICFFGYYCYLIINNFNELLYLIIYVILFLTVIITFITEKILKTKESDNRKEKRIKYEKNLIVKRIVKIVKYLAKGVTIIISIIGLLSLNSLTISSLFTIVSAVLLVLQILIEGIIYYVCKYIDLFKYAFILDTENIPFLKSFFGNNSSIDKLEKKAYELDGESYYTKQESIIIEYLKNNTEKFIKENKIQKREKKKELKKKIKISKSIIKQKQKTISKEHKIKIDKEFKKLFDKAKTLLTNPTELDNILKRVEKFIERLPKGVEQLKYIPIFFSLINNYLAKKYEDVSIEFVLSLLAILCYVILPFDVIPDCIPAVGYLDEAYLIGKCIDIFEDELTKFLFWRDNQPK